MPVFGSEHGIFSLNLLFLPNYQTKIESSGAFLFHICVRGSGSLIRSVSGLVVRQGIGHYTNRLIGKAGATSTFGTLTEQSEPQALGNGLERVSDEKK